MAEYGSLLTVMLLANIVMPNLGAPATSEETSGGPGAQVASRAVPYSDTVVDGVWRSGSNGNSGSNNGNSGSSNVNFGSNVNDGSSWKDPTSTGYGTWTTTTTKNGQCVNEFKVKGNKIDDTFPFPCSISLSTHSSNDDILIAGPDTVQVNSVYSKEPGKAQVIVDGKCSVRTYTFSGGKTTVTSSEVGDAECDAMKKEHLERLQEWQKWAAEKFPPCFPFCNTAKPGSAAAMNKKPSNYIPNNKPWSFPPCFPFCNKANPGSAAAMKTNPSNTVTGGLGSAMPAASGSLGSNLAQGSLLQNSSPWNANPVSTNSSSQNGQGNIVPNQSFIQVLNSIVNILQSWIKYFSSS